MKELFRVGIWLFRRNNDFEEAISTLVGVAYKRRIISMEEYRDFCISHFEKYYRKKYYNEEKACEDFYRRYFLDKRYSDFYTLFEYYDKAINERCEKKMVKVGGEFYGCYEDDWGRKRPLTTPVEWKCYFELYDKFIVCFEEELNRIGD